LVVVRYGLGYQVGQKIGHTTFLAFFYDGRIIFVRGCFWIRIPAPANGLYRLLDGGEFFCTYSALTELVRLVFDYSGIGLGVGAREARRMCELGAGVVATAVAALDFAWCESTVFSRTYIEIQIRMIEAPMINFRIFLEFTGF
jgi:hypothetical protein